MMFTLDTNILYYSIDTLNPDKRVLSRDIINRALLGNCFLTTQVLGEFLNAVRRKNAAAASFAKMQVEDWYRLFRTVDTTADLIIAGAALADRHRLQFWDSVIVAVADSVGAKIFITEDMQDGATVAGVTLLNPFNPANRHRLDALLAA